MGTVRVYRTPSAIEFATAVVDGLPRRPSGGQSRPSSPPHSPGSPKPPPDQVVLRRDPRCPPGLRADDNVRRERQHRLRLIDQHPHRRTGP
jgi:hypothetical protein